VVVVGIKLDTGSAESTLDDKGRVNIPKSFREHFQGELIITMDEYCAMILKPSVWEHFKNLEENSGELNHTDREAIKTMYYNQAELVELDNAGRITIPPVIRKYKKLSRNCIVIRDKDRLQIWDSGAYDAYLEEMGAVAKAAMNKLGSQDIFRAKKD
jgi:MraZ protein